MDEENEVTVQTCMDILSNEQMTILRFLYENSDKEFNINAFRQSKHTTIYCGVFAHFIQYIIIHGKNIHRNLCINSYFVTKICY